MSKIYKPLLFPNAMILEQIPQCVFDQRSDNSKITSGSWHIMKFLKSSLEYCYFIIMKKKLTYESRPIQVYSKHWKSIWHILWYSKAIFESLQWKVRHSHCSHFWSVIPNGSRHMQKWTHSALLVITETSKSICNFACPHNCPPKGNGDRTVPHNYHK